MKKVRLDVLISEQMLGVSRERAKAIIMSGSVFIAGQRADKPGMQVVPEAKIEIRSLSDYVSRGGQKLEKALEHFALSPEGKVCIDIGASTGGFTDCLLKYGASLVYAIDVGYGQLAWKIRSDPRVITMERTNIRYVSADMFEKAPQFAVIDVSFISLALVLPVVKRLVLDDGKIICLIKPQFEAGRDKVGKKGVVREQSTHIEVLETFIKNATESAFFVNGMTHSPVRGPEGNIEYLAWLDSHNRGACIDVDATVVQAHEVLA